MSCGCNPMVGSSNTESRQSATSEVTNHLGATPGLSHGCFPERAIRRKKGSGPTATKASSRLPAPSAVAPPSCHRGCGPSRQIADLHRTRRRCCDRRSSDGPRPPTAYRHTRGVVNVIARMTNAPMCGCIDSRSPARKDFWICGDQARMVRCASCPILVGSRRNRSLRSRLVNFLIGLSDRNTRPPVKIQPYQ